VAILDERVRQSVFGSLAAVGCAKPLGYLPLATIGNYLELNLDEWIRSLEKQGLKTKVFEAGECCIRSGALYAFDPLALQDVLSAASDVLENCSWPTIAESFVQQVAKIWVDPSHPAYAVIRRAFGEVQ
jgi:hypothetical protein